MKDLQAQINMCCDSMFALFNAYRQNMLRRKGDMKRKVGDVEEMVVMMEKEMISVTNDEVANLVKPCTNTGYRPQ